jgi:hypothetical protein
MKYKILFVLIFSFFRVTSQCILNLRDQKNDTPIAFANISNEKDNYITDENGKVNLDCKKNQTFKISHLGYQSQMINLYINTKDTLVYLRGNTIILNEILVLSKTPKIQLINKVNSKKHLRNSVLDTKIAVGIQNLKESNYKISKIEIPYEKFQNKKTINIGLISFELISFKNGEETIKSEKQIFKVSDLSKRKLVLYFNNIEIKKEEKVFLVIERNINSQINIDKSQLINPILYYNPFKDECNCLIKKENKKWVQIPSGSKYQCLEFVIKVYGHHL